MTVLTLAGKQIDWRKPPEPTDLVLWSKRDMYTRKVTGSLRTIAHLDHLDILAKARYGVGIVVIQPPFNTTVSASAGTHDYDACSDLYIPGVEWSEQQRFLRANGYACWWRKPPAFGHHIHGFTLPPREGVSISDDFAVHGFKVGKYVDGGHSLHGRSVASSQLGDYYEHRNALSGHAKDPSWFPPNIEATIFNLNAYIARQRNAQHRTAARPLKVALVNIANKIGRGAWIKCWHAARERGAIFGINESFTKRQRDTYAALVKASKSSEQPISQFGLRQTPNPVFWRSKRFKRIEAQVHRIHPRNTTARNAKQWPGFYDARYITEVVLEQRSNGKQVAVLNTHLAAGVKVIDQLWLNKVRKQSKRRLRKLVREHKAAGREVIVMGDMNMPGAFRMPKGFRWHVAAPIDKIGSTLNGKGGTFPAPTDHRHGGVRATVRL